MKESLNIVITGARSGIGLRLTQLMIDSGHHVAAGVRKPTEASDLKKINSDLLWVHELDVTSDESCDKFAKALKLNHVDILINNAGIYIQNDDRTTAQTSVQTLLTTFNTNCAGPLRVTAALLPLLKKSNASKIINITSKMGSIADNSSGGSTAYRVSKTALNMLTKSMALEFPETTVICIHPGWVKTAMGGSSAPLTVDQSAGGIIKLALSAGRDKSGQFLNYDGQKLPW